jgi:Glycosyltransferase family 87
VQFYTLARVGAAGEADHFDDFGFLRQAQLAAVPVSTNVWLPPVYGPQVALALAPLGYLSYRAALAVWVTLSTVVYLGACLVVAVRCRQLRPHPGLVLLAAVAFPPFWQLVQHGQLSVIATALIVGAWLALRSGRRVWAGVLLGLLVYKPPLLAPAIAVLCLAGEWRMVAGAIAGTLAEVMCVGARLGLDGLHRYWALELSLPRLAPLLATRPEQSHGLKAFWALLVPNQTAVLIVFVVTAAAVLILAAVSWRRVQRASLRMAILVIAITLAAPYLFVYDLTILAPAWLWLTDWYLDSQVPAGVGRALYLGYVAPLAAPFIPLIRLQPSVLCLAFLLAALWRFRGAPPVEVEAA